MEEGFNYARFYTLLKKLPGADKETLVSSFTNGRTVSLHEMSAKEYAAMCASLEEHTGWRVQLKKKRSLCLKLMQQAGIDTTDWQRINDFCRHPRIAGKVFAKLTLADLDSLQTKLRAIMRKGRSLSQPLRRRGESLSPSPSPKGRGVDSFSSEGRGVAIVFQMDNMTES
nr:MAG TPA: Protein of unknown function (DUF1018) [Caudoviricetes sp.]